MKCPKCEYLGFEPANRCRNCGYQFSLIEGAGSAGRGGVSGAGLQQRPASPVPTPDTLPLFGGDGIPDDEPLVSLPRSPRPPLAVRRTPSTPRRRTPAKPSFRSDESLAFRFADDPPGETVAPSTVDAASSAAQPRTDPPPVAQPTGRRAAAAAIDHALLLTIDVVVVHLTLRMASLTAADWEMLPPGPLLAFLGLLKMAYFLVFTAVGGQTLGKMAMGIRVVTEAGALPDGARALQRTLLGAVSVVTLGTTFLPAFVAPEGRALHDRVAGTRVVAVTRR